MSNDIDPSDFVAFDRANNHPVIVEFATLVKPYFKNRTIDFEI